MGMLEIFCAGFLQLAGGTSVHTVDALKKEWLIQSPNKPGRDAAIAGVAYVGYACKVHSLSPWVFLRKMLSFLCVYQCWSGVYKLVPCINTRIKDPTRLVELRQYQPCRDLS
jgi:hypothetical protein